MSMEEAGLERAAEGAATATVPFLSHQDIDRLTNFKWRYSLEAHGFSSAQAARLLFARWLYSQGSLRS